MCRVLGWHGCTCKWDPQQAQQRSAVRVLWSCVEWHLGSAGRGVKGVVFSVVCRTFAKVSKSVSRAIASHTVQCNIHAVPRSVVASSSTTGGAVRYPPGSYYAAYEARVVQIGVAQFRLPYTTGCDRRWLAGVRPLPGNGVFLTSGPAGWARRWE